MVKPPKSTLYSTNGKCSPTVVKSAEVPIYRLLPFLGRKARYSLISSRELKMASRTVKERPILV